MSITRERFQELLDAYMEGYTDAYRGRERLDWRRIYDNFRRFLKDRHKADLTHLDLKPHFDQWQREHGA